jgi:hypothetical protein
MTGIITHITGERAPCGRLVDGDRSRDDDGEGLRLDDLTYRCGCHLVNHEFHDGSMRIRTIRHDGKVLMDVRSGDHEA